MLKRVWEQDNNKDQLLLEFGQLGGVCGDVFIKVAYEDAWTDSIGMVHAGKVRIIPCNPSHCVDEETEILTSDGWKRHDQVAAGTQILTVDPNTDDITWQPVKELVKRHHAGDMYRWQNERFDALTTDGHRWLAKGRPAQHKFVTTADMHSTQSSGTRIVTGGGVPMAFSPIAKHSDDWVELVGWFLTEGSWNRDCGAYICQSVVANPDNVARIRRALRSIQNDGFRITEQVLPAGRETIQWYIGATATRVLKELCPGKQLTPEFIRSLTFAQAQLLYDVLMLGDGHVRPDSGTQTWYQDDDGRSDGFQMLAAMLGKRTHARYNVKGKNNVVSIYKNRLSSVKEMDRTVEQYDGIVWCPVVEATTWLARRNGVTYWTGNCYPEFHPHDRHRLIRFKLKYRFWSTLPDGTRGVNTYVEITTETLIEEYVNDECISQRPNPLGRIPFVHISNMPVSGSPWGLSDIADIIPLNREYNEKMLEISDIINYYSSPITVVVGAKATQLEKGPRKTWMLPAGSEAKNLETVDNLAGPLGYMDLLKRAMHELTGVPESALGQMQPISNTSGVALHITYQPLMNKWKQKKIQYSVGFQQTNELILLTLAQKEPWSFIFNPNESTMPEPGQLTQLDPRNPATYETNIHWPSPLPVDILVKLNEIMMKMQLGLESKRGAMADLGEEFPDLKLDEIFNEQISDAQSEGALQLVRSAITMAVMFATGIPQNEDAATQADDAGKVSSAGGAPAPPPKPVITPEVQNMLSTLTTKAYGTKLAQYRNPSNSDDN